MDGKRSELPAAGSGHVRKGALAHVLRGAAGLLPQRAGRRLMSLGPQERQTVVRRSCSRGTEEGLGRALPGGGGPSPGHCYSRGGTHLPRSWQTLLEPWGHLPGGDWGPGDPTADTQAHLLQVPPEPPSSPQAPLTRAHFSLWDALGERCTILVQTECDSCS